MRKHLLLTTNLFVISLLNAQVTTNIYTSKIPAHLVNKSAISIDKNKGADLDPGFAIKTAINNKPKIVANKNAQASTLTSTVIGHSYYDLETNGSVSNRIVVNNDGTIAAAWMIALEDGVDDGNVYPNRGTGYNYFDGATWGPEPSVKIESVKTGWPALANLPSGKEVFISHGISGGKLDVVSRSVKGIGTWTENITAITTATTGGNFWPRLVSTNYGDTLYALSLTYPISSGGALYQGLDGALVFHRSVDGGVSWDMNNVVPTGLDASTNKFVGFKADGYAIACKGNVIAIVAGDQDRDAVMVKSMDAGATWVATTVWDCPIDKWDHTTTTSDYDNDGDADTLETNDGSFTIAIDNNNEVCVAFGAMRIYQDAVSFTQNWAILPYTDGIYFWKESMGASAFPIQTPVIVAGIEDLGAPGIYFPPGTTTYPSPFGSFACSLSSFPSLAIDQNNDIYMLYSSIVDGSQSGCEGARLVRHEYIVKSPNGGTSWSTPFDIMNGQNTVEGVYGSLATKIDGNLHVLYMRDCAPGWGILPTDGDVYEEFVCSKIPTSDITVGVEELTKSSITAFNLYPNPASTNATIEVTLNESNKMEIVMMNHISQTIYSGVQHGNIGLNKMNLNLNDLSSGIYFCQVKVGNG